MGIVYVKYNGQEAVNILEDTDIDYITDIKMLRMVLL